MSDLDDIVREFLVESEENLSALDSELVALESDPTSRPLLASIFRTIHTLKGTAGFLGFANLERLTHVGETLLGQLRDGQRVLDPHATDVLLVMVDTVRTLLSSIETTGTEADVDVSEVTASVEAVINSEPGQPVVTAAQPAPAAATPSEQDSEDAPVAQSARPKVAKVSAKRAEEKAPEAVGEVGESAIRSAAESSVRVDVDLLDVLMRQVGELVLARNQIVALSDTASEDVKRAAARLSLLSGELQEAVMRTRMQPLDALFDKLPRVVRDVAAACGRQVRLVRVGGDTELDRSLLEAVKDPLTHLVRNAIDHGIETSEQRIAAAKDATGVLTVRAQHAGGQVIIDVCDDGKGIDPQVVADKAVAKGLRTEAQVAAMETSELLSLLFLPGFSTAEKVTNVSGRGVGMDVVRTKIEAIGGTVEVDSTVGVGTTWRLRIPLTLAIMPALTVECASWRYALPQVAVLELVALTPENVTHLEHVGDAPVYRLRGELLSLVSLREVLALPAAEPGSSAVIVVAQADQRRFGLVVDSVLSTEEIVVKALSPRLKVAGVYSGATLLADGAVSLIVDVSAIARRHLDDVSAATESGDAITSSNSEQLLVADAGTRRVAVPLSQITRLEQVEVSSFERLGNRTVLRYRGQIVPVAFVAEQLGEYAETASTHVPAVIVENGTRTVALVVSAIVDVLNDNIADRSDLTTFGALGTTVLAERVTELLDVQAMALAVDPDFLNTATGEQR